MDNSLLVATTTDSKAVAEAAASNNEQAARVPATKPESQELDGSAVVSTEHPRSERTLLLERLKRHEQDLQTLVQTSDDEPTSDEGEATAETDDAERREEYYRQQAAQHLPPPQQVELDRLRAELAGPFAARMAQIRTPDLAELAQARVAEGLDISTPVMDALLALPGGPEATIHLLKNPDEIRRLASLPDYVAVAEVGRLTARLSLPTKRVSNAPRPISPVGNSSTKSSLPLDELPYQEFRRAREQQQKARYRR